MSPIDIFKNKRNTEQFKSSSKLFVPNKKSKVAFTLAEVFLKHSANNRKKAFTLAEVLITLGIIGVVAAMTLPTLVAHHKKRTVETKLAKVYSVMNQAFEMQRAKQGDYSAWIPDCGPSSSPTCTSEDVLNWYNDTIGQEIKTLRVEIPEYDNGIDIYLVDGSILHMEKFIYDVDYYIDKKARSNPVSGANRFQFRVNPYVLSHQTGDDVLSHTKKPFETYAWSLPAEYSIDDLINGSDERVKTSYLCNKDKNRAYCARVIQMNGWKIPKNYPIPF